MTVLENIGFLQIFLQKLYAKGFVIWKVVAENALESGSFCWVNGPDRNLNDRRDVKFAL